MSNEQCESLKICAPRQQPLTNECIRVNKVYDWVTIPTDEVRQIPIPEASLTLIQDAINNGHELIVNGTIALPTGVVSNVVSVIRKTVIIDGREVEVGCAQILKTVTLTITVFDTTVSTTTPLTSFAYTFQLLERAGLCFPEPFTTDNISLKVVNATAEALSNVPVNDDFIFEIRICQDLQVETEVKLEVEGRFCQPRGNTIDCGTNGLICPTPTFPPNCPNIFPIG